MKENRILVRPTCQALLISCAYRGTLNHDALASTVTLRFAPIIDISDEFAGGISMYMRRALDAGLMSMISTEARRYTAQNGGVRSRRGVSSLSHIRSSLTPLRR